jgi:hypothetical protein
MELTNDWQRIRRFRISPAEKEANCGKSRRETKDGPALDPPPGPAPGESFVPTDAKSCSTSDWDMTGAAGVGGGV